MVNLTMTQSEMTCRRLLNVNWFRLVRHACILASVVLMLIWICVTVGLRGSSVVTGFRQAQKANRATKTLRDTTPAQHIPRHFHFSYKFDFIKHPTEATLLMAANVKALVERHGVPFTIWSDADCVQLLTQHGLAEAYEHENYGPFKSDMCRMAALYESGGFYMDNDLYVESGNVIHTVEKVKAKFASVVEMSDGGIFQAFLASTPKHPVVAESLTRMAKHYAGTYELKSHRLVGPCTLRDAIEALPAESIYLFAEVGLPWHLHSTFSRAMAAVFTKDCAAAVVDPGESGKLQDALPPLMYSRIVGGSRSCPTMVSVLQREGWYHWLPLFMIFLFGELSRQRFRKRKIHTEGQ